jgi:hypothetical protein
MASHTKKNQPAGLPDDALREMLQVDEYES